MASYTPQYSNVPIGSTSEVQGGLFHSRNKDEAKAENNKRSTLMLAAYQNDLNVENWLRSNEYNTPENQMARYRSAGLNPNLIYGQMQNADGVAGANASPAQFYDGPNEMDILQGVTDVGTKIGSMVQSKRQHSDNLVYQYDALETNTRKDVALALAQIASTYQSDKMKADTAKEIAKMNNTASSEAQDKELEIKRSELAEVQRVNDKKIEQITSEIENNKELTKAQKAKLYAEVNNIKEDTKRRQLEYAREALLNNKYEYEAILHELQVKGDMESAKSWTALWNGDWSNVDGKVIARTATTELWNLLKDGLQAFAGARGASAGRGVPGRSNNR